MLRRGRGNGDDRDLDAVSSRNAFEIVDVVDRHAAARLWPTFALNVSNSAEDLEAFLAEARVIGEREAQIAGAHDGDAQLAVEAENLAQMPLQIAHVVADAADAELAEVREVLPYLRRVQMKLLGQRLRGDRADADAVELVQAPEIDGETVGGEFGDLFEAVLALGGLVRRFHKPIGIVRKIRMLISRPWLLRVTAAARTAHQNSGRTFRRPSRPQNSRSRPIIIGALFGLLFGASTVYLGLRAGLTVSASIPIAVLAISVFKKLGRSTILENNIVQTIGSAGESVAGGVVFTVPALIFLTPYGPGYFKYFQIMMLATAGGHSRYVDDGAAAPRADRQGARRAAVSGRRRLRRRVDRRRTRRRDAATVFKGLGVGAAWKALSWIVQVFRTVIGYSLARASFFPNATVNIDISPEYMGVGYVIGPRIAGVMFAGGVLSWLVLLPLLSIAGRYMTVPFPPVPASGLGSIR